MYSADLQQDEINDDALLDADNSAWRRSARAQAPRCRAAHPSGLPKYIANRAQVLITRFCIRSQLVLSQFDYRC